MRRREFIGALGGAGVLGATDVVGADGDAARDEGAARSGGGTVTDVENVILLIGDGMGFDAVEIASLVYGDLTLQSMAATGYTRTASRSGEVTDSAAAGTALATGVKAYNRQLSVYGPDGDEDVAPLTTQLEAAAAVGKATGLVSTARITHATPGAFAAHVPDRGMEEAVADQLLDAEVDVLLGGGRREWSDERFDRARDLGYEILADRDDLAAAGDGKLLGTFAESHVPFVLDRDETVPSLPELTDAALDRLDGGVGDAGDDEGFFLMVEGARIDHAGHRNDVQSSAAEVEEFDRAVERALAFAEDRDDTLVVVTSDHETGGLTTGTDYGSPIDRERIREATASNVAMDERIREGEPIDEVLLDGVDVDPDEDEVERIKEAIDGDYRALRHAIGDVVADRVGVAWASTEHTGPAQLVLAAGPGVEPVTGWFHHTDLSVTLAGIQLFGCAGDPPADGWDEWEARIVADGPEGVRDAARALRYVGPADDEVTEALDVGGDGVVDYGDVLAIADVEAPVRETCTSPRRPQALHDV